MANVCISKKNQGGFSMVELMVAMTVSLILVGGVLQIFLSTKQSYRVNEGLARMQENARFGLLDMTDDVRQAGFWGCAPIDRVLDRQTFNAVDFGGVTPALNGGFSIIDNDADSANAIADGTDSITIRGAFGRGVPVTAHGGLASSVSLQTDQNITGTSPVFDTVVAPEVVAVVVSSCNDAEIRSLNTSVIDRIPINGVPFNTNFGAEPSMVYAVGELTYAVNTNNELTREIRRMDDAGNVAGNANAIVENIENLQIQYGVDTDGDLIPNYYENATAATDRSTVVALRLILTVISDDNLASVPTVNSIDGSTDNRLRQVYSSTIKLRNRIPNVQ